MSDGFTRVTRTVHVDSKIKYAPMTELCPDMIISLPSGETAMGMAFIDGDGEQHVYVFSEDGKADLLKQMNGGGLVLVS
jgi:hypothetical protein